MKIPKFVKEFLEWRAEWAIYSGIFRNGWDPTCTLFLHKRSYYCTVDTLKKDAERFCAWCNRQIPALKDYPRAVILMCPAHTHHCDQYAVIRVYDPVLQQIEKFIPEKYRYGTRGSR